MIEKEFFTKSLSLLELSHDSNEIEDVLGKLSEFFNELFDCFCISLLRGDYVNNHTLKEILLESKNTIDSKLQDLSSINDVDLYRLQDGIAYIRKAFMMLIEMYQSFIDSIYNSVKSSLPIEIIDTSTFYQFQSLQKKKGCFKNVSEKVQLFGLFLGLNSLDYFFNESIEQYKVLLRIENSIRKLMAHSDFTDNVLRKISFLKYKWEARSIRDSESRSVVVYGKTISLENIDSIKLFNNNTLDTWKNYLEDHYEINDNWKLKIRELSEHLYTKDVNELSILEVHTLIKYSKDIINDKNKIKVIVERVKVLMYSATEEKHCYKKIYAYSLNNYLSSLTNILEDDLFDQDEYLKIRSLKKEIDINDDVFRNYNFFSDSKYLDYLLRRVDKYLKMDVVDREKYKVEIELDVTEIDKIIKDSNRKLLWSKKYFNYISSLPYKECLVETPSEKLPKMYYASSFILPAPSFKTNLEFEVLLSDANNTMNGYEIFKRFDKEVQKIESSEKEIKITVDNLAKEISSNKVESISILGIFTAILSFVMANVQMFKAAKTIKEYLLVSLTIGSVLCLFSYILTLALKKEKDKASIANSIVFISLMIILSLYTLFK